MTITQLSKQSGIKYNTLYRRLKILKWDEKIALTTPISRPRDYKKIIKRLQKKNDIPTI